MTKQIPLPFGLLNQEQATQERGYGVYPKTWGYDPKSQVSDLIIMGETSPTTRCMVDSTGIITSDSDESNDDTGKD